MFAHGQIITEVLIGFFKDINVQENSRTAEQASRLTLFSPGYFSLNNSVAVSTAAGKETEELCFINVIYTFLGDCTLLKDFQP